MASLNSRKHVPLLPRDIGPGGHHMTGIDARTFQDYLSRCGACNTASLAHNSYRFRSPQGADARDASSAFIMASLLISSLARPFQSQRPDSMGRARLSPPCASGVCELLSRPPRSQRNGITLPRRGCICQNCYPLHGQFGNATKSRPNQHPEVTHSPY
jgi:hypothetical protein